MKKTALLFIMSLLALPRAFAAGDQELMEKEVMVSLSEQKAIEALQRIIDKRRGTAEEAELWERMSELYLKQAKTAHFFQINKTSDKTMSFLPPIVREKTTLRPLQKAMECFATIERRFPKYPDMDRILFHSSLTAAQMGMFQHSTTQIQKLLNNYTKSELLPDAHLLMGEILYDQKNFSTALTHFKKAAESKKEKISQYAQYKAAWSQYNMHQGAAAMVSLEALVRSVDPERPEGFALRAEALRDLALFMTEMQVSDDAYTFFSRFTTEKETADTLLRMVNIYRSHSRHKEATALADLYLKKSKYEVGQIQFNLFFADYYRDMKNGKLGIEHIRKAYNGCSVLPEKSEACETELKSQISQTAELWWKEWEKKKSPESLQYARQALEIDINGNPNPRPQALEAYAELLFQSADYEKASRTYHDLYESLVKQGEKDQVHLEKLSYASLVALDRQMTADKSKILPQETFKIEVEAYLKNFPKSAHRNELTLKWAALEFSQGQYASSELKLRDVLANKPAADIVVPTQNQLLEALKNQKKTNDMQDLLGQWIAAKPAAARRAELTRLQAQLGLENIESSSASKDAAVVLKDLMDFIKKYESDEKITEPVMWKALGLALLAKDNDTSLKLIQDLGPKHAKDPRIWDSLKQILLHLPEIKSTAIAQKTFDLSLQYVPQKDRGSLLWSYREYLQKQNRMSEATKAENEIVSLGLEPERSLILVSRLEKDLDQGKSKKVFEESKKFISKTLPDVVRARARILQARVLESELKEQKVKSSLDRLQAVLAIKLERLTKAQEAYVSAIKMSNDSFVISLAQEGLRRCFEHSIQALKHVEVKDQLSADEKKVLDEQIQTIVTPLESKLKELGPGKQAEAHL